MVKREEGYAFRKELLTVHAPSLRDAKRTPQGVLFALEVTPSLVPRSARIAQWNPVHIRRSEIGKLACQA